MHDGRFKTLEEVMAFYKTLPEPVAVGHRELVLTLLDERVDSRDLIEFLKSLSAPLPDAPWLQDPHSAR
jgi:cytochrome c peroxidase